MNRVKKRLRVQALRALHPHSDIRSHPRCNRAVYKVLRARWVFTRMQQKLSVWDLNVSLLFASLHVA